MGRLLIALSLCTALAACASGGPPGPPTPAVSPTADASPAPVPDAAPTADRRGGGPVAGRPDRPAQAHADGAVVSVPSDRAPLGALCRTYLRDQVPRLVVEADWQAGAAPAAGVLDHLLAVLRGVARKPGGAAQAGSRTGPGDPERVWRVADLRREADRVRTQRTSPGQAAIHVLFVRGRFTERDVIGVAHSASEIAVFPDAIGGLSTLLGGQPRVQRSVLVHELGHLLCLVNLSYRSHHDREDPAHPHHSTDRSSVMYWAIDTTAVGALFTGPPPDDFTAQDRDDLRRLAVGDA
jgi:hypothetical protein